VVSGVFIDGSAAPSTGSTATYVGTDATTRGNWPGRYGSQGYALAADGTMPGTTASMAVSGHATWTWAASTTDTRALMRAGGSSRLAAAWFSPTAFTVDVTLADGVSRTVSLYCVDWDANGRSQAIEVLDAATGAVLDRRGVEAFSGGVYVSWTVRGAVRLRVVNAREPNAVASAVFVDLP
jgi:hypothetical protein